MLRALIVEDDKLLAASLKAAIWLYSRKQRT